MHVTNPVLEPVVNTIKRVKTIAKILVIDLSFSRMKNRAMTVEIL